MYVEQPTGLITVPFVPKTSSSAKLRRSFTGLGLSLRMWTCDQGETSVPKSVCSYTKRFVLCHTVKSNYGTLVHFTYFSLYAFLKFARKRLVFPGEIHDLWLQT